MGVKKFLLHVYSWGLLPVDRVNYYQGKIRAAEWDAVKKFIPAGAGFLDVGCGAGDNLLKAQQEMKCKVTGVDPEPGAHGVGKNVLRLLPEVPILKAVAEQLPFDPETFDVVFCSHVLEHVDDRRKALLEMQRVLRDNGVLIIGMPTATMACIGWITQVLFTGHMRFFSFFLHPFFNTPSTRFKHIFFPPSHSDARKTVLSDLRNYRITQWKKTVDAVFKIEETILPAVYPYPDFRQPFKLFRAKHFGSSVFFICTKKNPASSH